MDTKYEFNVTLSQSGDLWYYTVAQEFDSRVEFLGWGYAESADAASDCIRTYIRDQF